MQHIGIYILNGLIPSPQVEMKICSQKRPNQLEQFCLQCIGPSGVHNHKEFECFFACQDQCLYNSSCKSLPNFKISPLLKHCAKVSKEVVVLGEILSADEQTIGFQGPHQDKLKIDYKDEGDGFQADSLCSDGYTWIFYFCNQPAPKKYLDQGLSSLHAYVTSMFD